MDMREQLYMLAIEEHGGIRGGQRRLCIFLRLRSVSS